MPERYPWWGYVRYIVRQYPDWEESTREDLHLSEREADGLNAVRNTITSTERMGNGLLRLKAIRALHWDRTHTLEGAALEIPCDKSTVSRWQKKFFEDVAKKAGYL